MKDLKQVGKILLLLISGGIIGYFIAGFIPKGSLVEGHISIPTLGKIGLVFLCFLIMFFVILWHELGHIFGGLLVGDKFGFLAVGPLWVEKENDGLKWRLNKDLGTFGGLAFVIPQKNQLSFKVKRSMMVGGGPIASLILALGTFGIATFPAVGAYLDLLLKICAFFSLFIFIVTIIPMKTGGFMSDGMQLLKIFQGDQAAKQYQEVNQIMAQNYQGLLPKDWDIVNLDFIKDAQNLNLAMAGTVFAYYHYLDKAQIDKAATAINFLVAHIDHYPKAFQGDLWIEICLFKIYFEKDWEFYKEKKSLITPSAKKRNKLSNLLIEAALANREERINDLKTLCAQADTIKRSDGISKLYQKLMLQFYPASVY